MLRTVFIFLQILGKKCAQPVAGGDRPHIIPVEYYLYRCVENDEINSDITNSH